MCEQLHEVGGLAIVAGGDAERGDRHIRGAAGGAGEEDDGGEVGPHMGIGLWIVRRNLQAIGGSVRAENRPDGGLAMVMRFLLAD